MYAPVARCPPPEHAFIHYGGHPGSPWGIPLGIPGGSPGGSPWGAPGDPQGSPRDPPVFPSNGGLVREQFFELIPNLRSVQVVFNQKSF